MKDSEFTPQCEISSVPLWQGLEEVAARPILVDGLLQRGVVTFVVGKGASAKSLFAMTIGLMVSAGGAWAHWEARNPGTVLIMNAEDDLQEQRRRLWAAAEANPCLRDYKPLETISASSNVLFELGEGGGPSTSAAWAALLQIVAQKEPDLIIIDPLVEHHVLNENDNGHMAFVVAHLRRLARHANCSVLVVHHGRKGATGGDQDGARGASALVNAARSAITMEPMTEEQAKGRLAPDQLEMRHRFIGVADAKMNYAERLGERFLLLDPKQHPNGDFYPALTKPRDNVLPDDAAIVSWLDGKDFSAATRGQKAGRADAEIAEYYHVSPSRAKDWLRAARRNGLIHNCDLTDRKGHEKTVVRAGPAQGQLGE